MSHSSIDRTMHSAGKFGGSAAFISRVVGINSGTSGQYMDMILNPKLLPPVATACSTTTVQGGK